MTDFSIELSAEQITDTRTKRFFSEVQGCYAAGYYRSAVVMLWSVVVADILFKLDHLANAYADTTAQKILADIGKARAANPKSPEWEAELVNKVASQTELLDHPELASLNALQTHRHLSAHPVISSSDALFSPNKETTRAHIRNALESVLTKSPIMSRKVFDHFMQDIEQLSRLEPDRNNLKQYLEAKYFPHFSPVTIVHIFKNLWRVTFKSEDERADANRKINEKVLEVIFEHRKSDLTKLIQDERNWFSEVSVKSNPIALMTRFFRQYPQVFSLLTDAVKVPIQKYSETSLDHFAGCWFISQNPREHIEVIRQKIDAEEILTPNNFRGFCESLMTSNDIFGVFDIGIELYRRSTSFDLADERFNLMIRPFIASYSINNVQNFLKACETCTKAQATGRGKAKDDHGQIKAIIDEKFPTISLENYPAFNSSLG